MPNSVDLSRASPLSRKVFVDMNEFIKKRKIEEMLQSGNYDLLECINRKYYVIDGLFGDIVGRIYPPTFKRFNLEAFKKKEGDFYDVYYYKGGNIWNN